MALYTPSTVQGYLKAGIVKPEQLTGLTYEGQTIVAGKYAGSVTGGTKAVKARARKSWWPEKKKIEAATLYAALGNFRRVADIAKVPVTTVERWATEDWWLMTISKVRREQAEEMDVKTTKIVDKALDKIMERIEDGDYIYDMKAGKAVPMPVSARDLAIVAGTIFDKRQLIRGEATKISKAVQSEDFLEKLADKFIAFSKGKTTAREAVTVDAEVVEEK